MCVIIRLQINVNGFFSNNDKASSLKLLLSRELDLDTLLQSTGWIDKREETLEREIATLEGEEERLDRRMSAYEERLMQQFIAMENILNGLNNSGTFLDNLFKSLPFTSSKD